MQISIEEARSLLERVMQRQGYTADEAVIIVDHLMDAELRGLRQGGLARAIK